MSISTDIIRIKNDIDAAYSAVSNKGGVVPSEKKLDNLESAIRSIPTGLQPELRVSATTIQTDLIELLDFSSIWATDGEQTIYGVKDGDEWSIKVSLGTWNIQGIIDGKTTKITTIVVDTVKQYKGIVMYKETILDDTYWILDADAYNYGSSTVPSVGIVCDLEIYDTNTNTFRIGTNTSSIVTYFMYPFYLLNFVVGSTYAYCQSVPVASMSDLSFVYFLATYFSLFGSGSWKTILDANPVTTMSTAKSSNKSRAVHIVGNAIAAVSEENIPYLKAFLEAHATRYNTRQAWVNAVNALN